MVNITSTTQLSTFELIRTSLTGNSTLSQKFNNSNILQYEPKHKGVAATPFPYIWINIPGLGDDHPVFDNSVTIKTVTVDLFLRVEYLAREKFLDYSNAIIAALEGYESTFNGSGYYDVKCELLNVDPSVVFDEKDVVEGVFELSFTGQVSR